MEAKKRKARETLGDHCWSRGVRGQHVECGGFPGLLPGWSGGITGSGGKNWPGASQPDPSSALSGSAQLGGEGHCDPRSPPLSSGQNSIRLNESSDMEGRTWLLPGLVKEV